MKALKAALVLTAVLLGVAASADASAHHHRGRVGIFIGAPAFWYYPPPYYYYPPPYYYYPAAPAQPTEYVERIDPSEQGWWYYCEESRGYYPYVKECATAWKRVSPTPPAPSSSVPSR